MSSLPSELQLLHFVLLNAAVLYAAWRFVRRWTDGDSVQRWLDTLLIWYGVQYLAICLPGVAGGLSVVSSSAAAIAFSAGLAISSSGKRIDIDEKISVDQCLGPRYDDVTFVAALCFAAGNFITYAWNQAQLPVVSTDGLGYHLPVALQWLREGSITPFDAWYWNPANAYSPLAGEAFIAWLYTPLAGDAFARFVQVGSLLMLTCAVIQIGRAAGLSRGSAALVAAAVMIARPFRIESTIVKDDLFVAAFFYCAIAACWKFAADRFGPYRLGLSLGLLIATKYPAILTLPLFILVIAAPFRAGWRWRQGLIVLGVAGIVAGPWFVRNLILFRNPLYPVDVQIFGHTLFRGIFTLAPDPRLRSIGGFWGMLTEGHYGLPLPVTIAILAATIILWIVAFRRLDLANPFFRFTLLGSVLGTIVFLLASPHPEARYFLPFLPPTFLCFGLVAALAGEKLFARSRTRLLIRDGLLWCLLLACACSTFILALWQNWVIFLTGGLVMMVVGVAVLFVPDDLKRRMKALRLDLIFGALSLACIAAYSFVNWGAYDEQLRTVISPIIWSQLYGPIAEGWRFVETEIPADNDIAYANTNLLYPLQITAPRRKLIYVPVRADFKSFRDLPYLGRNLDGYALTRIVTATMVVQADRGIWLPRLLESGAKYLFVAKRQVADNPPELAFARQDPKVFIPVFENDNAIIFRIDWTESRPPSVK